LAGRFAAANQAMIDLIVGAPEDAMGRMCDAEGWSVAAVGAHVAVSHDFLVERVWRIVAGEASPPVDPVAFHAQNARAAEEHARLGRDEVVALLRAHGAQAAAFLGGLSDDDLECTRSIPAMSEQPVTAEQVVERVLIGHVNAHLESLRQTLGMAG
jgi:hypothetical protein